MKKEIKSKEAPQAIGPYSQAIKIEGLLFISGQLPINPKTQKMGNTIEEQTELCLQNASAICKEAGVDLKDSVKVTVLLNDINNFQKVNEIYGTYFEQPYPARVAYEVANLPLDAKIEIDFIVSCK